jgi:hypothetical protein
MITIDIVRRQAISNGIVSHFENRSLQTMNANDDAALGGDLVFEGKAIAEYWGLSEKKCRHLMASGQLPGAFQIGGRWFLSKSAAREAVHEKARRGTMAR